MSASATQTSTTAATLSAWFTEMYDDLARLSHDTEKALSRARGKRQHLAVRDLRVVRDSADTFLAKHPAPEAAGVVFRPGVMGDEGDIEWWKREPNGESSRVLFTLTPQTAGYYDFEALDWFRNVVETGQPTLTGPYVDYAGMDQYILTMTVPFRLDGEIIGAAGCDIELRELETALMPTLREIADDAALVTRTGRVVLGNSGRFLVGNRIHDLSEIDTTEISLHDLGLMLVTAPRERF